MNDCGMHKCMYIVHNEVNRNRKLVSCAELLHYFTLGILTDDHRIKKWPLGIKSKHTKLYSPTRIEICTVAVDHRPAITCQSCGSYCSVMCLHWFCKLLHQPRIKIHLKLFQAFPFGFWNTEDHKEDSSKRDKCKWPPCSVGASSFFKVGVEPCNYSCK